MIKKHVLLSILGLFIACTVGAQDNSMADEKAIVKSGNMRFTVLTPEMIRIEYSAKLQFEDRASFVVINRHLPVPNFTQEERDGYLYLTTDKLELRYKLGTYPVSNDRCNPNLQITLDVNGVEEVWYPGKQDPYNLKGTTRTLDRAEGDVREWLENGLLSRVGWAVIDEREPRKDGSLSLMFERDTNGGMDWVAQRKDTAALDMYFMGYGHDYKKALGDFTKIAGKIPLPPLYVFGYWYSKFQRYTEQDMRDIVNEIRSRDIPMDVLVIDMDWHRNGKTGSTDGTEWTGWSWNKALFPDPAGFISWLHDEQNLNTTLNLHPADGVFPKEDNYDALYADLAGRYSDIKADSLTNEDGTIRWNIENKDFYEAFFEGFAYTVTLVNRGNTPLLNRLGLYFISSELFNHAQESGVFFQFVTQFFQQIQIIGFDGFQPFGDPQYPGVVVGIRFRDGNPDRLRSSGNAYLHARTAEEPFEDSRKIRGYTADCGLQRAFPFL